MDYWVHKWFTEGGNRRWPLSLNIKIQKKARKKQPNVDRKWNSGECLNVASGVIWMFSRYSTPTALRFL